MTDENASIGLDVGVAGGASLDKLQAQLNGILEKVNRLQPNLSSLGAGGVAQMDSLTTAAARLNAQIAQITRSTDLQKVAKEAGIVAKLLKEIAIEQNSTSKAVQQVVKNGDQSSVESALIGVKRKTEAALFIKGELTKLADQAEGTAQKIYANEVKTLNNALAGYQRQQVRLIERQATLQEQLNNERELNRRQAAVRRSEYVEPRFAATPEGQRVAATRAAALQAAESRRIEAAAAREASLTPANLAAEAARRARATTRLVSSPDYVENEGARLNAADRLRSATRAAAGPTIAQTEAEKRRVIAGELLEQRRERAAEVAEALFEDRKRTRDLNFQRSYDVDDAKTIEAARRRAAVEQLLEERRQRAAEVAEALFEDRARTRALKAGKAYDDLQFSAAREDFRRNPVNQAQTKLAQLQTQIAAIQNNPEQAATVQQITAAKAQLAALARPTRVKSQLTVEEQAQQEVDRDVRRYQVDRAKETLAKNNPNLPPTERAPTEFEKGETTRNRRREQITGDNGAFLFETQARLQAQYIGLNALFQGATEGIRAVVEFDKAMKNLQAVTGTTDKQLQGLEHTILSISRDSVFSAHELAQAAEEMAKNGLSLAEVQTTLKNASILASATGNSLHASTEVLVSTLETFKVQNSEATVVLDQTFQTLNSSRLNVEKLNEALQGVGVTAKDSGLSFAEFSASLATLANAGLSSTTQLNQGFRQVLTVLSEPTSKFKAKLDELGISITDVDPKLNSLVGVFENLRRGGFTTADAFSTLQARVATTFVTFLNNTEAYKSNYAAILNSTGAAQAQGKALESLEDQVRRLGNTFTALAVNSTGPVKTALTGLVQGVNYVATSATEAGTAWTVFTTVITGFGVAAAAKSIGGLIVNLQATKNLTAAVSTVWRAAGLSASALAVAEGEAAVATVSLGTALGGLAAALGPGLLIAGAIGAFYLLATSTNEAADAAEKLKARESELKDALEEKRKSLEKVNEFLDTTISRSARLQGSQEELARAVDEARNQFGNLDTNLHTNITTFGQLITKLREFRNELRAATNVDLQQFIQNKDADLRAIADRIAGKTGDQGAVALSRKLGLKEINPYVEGGAVTDITDSKTANTELDNQFKNNPLGQEMLAAIRDTNLTVGKVAEAQKHLYDLGKGNLSETEIKAFDETLKGIAGELAARNAATAAKSGATDELAKGEFSLRPGVVSTVQPALERLAARIGNGTGLDSIRGGTARVSAQESLAIANDPDFKALETFVNRLTKEDAATFRTTKEGRDYDSLKSLSEGIYKKVVSYSQKELQSQTGIELKAIDAELKVQEKLISDSRNPAERDAARTKALDLVKQAAAKDRELLRLRTDNAKGEGLQGLDTLDAEHNFSDAEVTSKAREASLRVDDLYRNATERHLVKLNELTVKALDAEYAAADKALTQTNDPAVRAAARDSAKALAVEISKKELEALTAKTAKERSFGTEDPKNIDLADKVERDRINAQLAERIGNIDSVFRNKTDQQVRALGQELIKNLEGQFNLEIAKGAETKDPKVRAAASNAARTLAFAIEQNELRLLDAKTKAALANGDDPKLVNLSDINRRQEIQSQYERNLLRSKTLDDKKNPKEKKDPNRDFDPKIEDYAKQGEGELAIADKKLATGLAEGRRPLELQKASLQAARDTNVIPKAVTDLQAHKLNELEIQRQIADIALYLAQLQTIKDLQVKETANLAKVTLEIDALFNKYDLKINEDGSVSSKSGKITSEEQRSEINKTYDAYLRQRRALQSDDQQSGLLPRLAADGQNVQGKLDTATAIRDARDQKNQGFGQEQVATGFQAVSAGFAEKNGLNDSAYKQYADTLTSTFEKMNTSFGSFIENFVSGNLKGKNSFRDFASSILKDALRIQSQKLASELLGTLLNFAGSALGSAFGPTTLPAGGGGSPNGYQGMVMHAYQGMYVPKYDQGGIVPGVHIGRDSVNAFIAPGEAILNRSATSLIGENGINAINAGALKKSQSMPTLPAPRAPDLVNVYVVDKNTTPQLGKKDVLAAVGEDILAGGATRKLIQQVALGA